MLTPMQTRRAQQAQGFVNIIYAPLSIIQLVSLYALYHLKFVELPKMYLASFGLMLSFPCVIVWCLCLCCATRYAKQDFQLVHSQRLERAKAIVKQQGKDRELENSSSESPAAGQVLLVDCTEAIASEYELIFTA